MDSDTRTKEQNQIICAKCESQNLIEHNFCGKCGSQLREKVFQKGKLIHKPLSEDVFNECYLSKSQRKHVTVFFTDLAGYTSLTENLDPEDVRSILTQIFTRIETIISKYDGFIERYLGDSVMAVFGIPRSHENDPERALNAAIEIHQTINKLKLKTKNPIKQKICMHTGINTGLVITGDIDAEKGSHGLTGLTINVASRLESIAQDDEIIVGQTTYQLAKNDFEFETLPPTSVKGVKEPLNIYKLISPKKKRTYKSQLFFSGRQKELFILQQHQKDLLLKGKGHLLFILGEPGIGKTRLIDEFKKKVDTNQITWIESKSSSYLSKTTYGTFLELLKNYSGIEPSDDYIQGWDKLEDKLRDLFNNEEVEILPYLAALLSFKVKDSDYKKLEFIDGETLKSQIFRSFYILLKRLTAKKPVVLVFEDFHWVDQSTVDLLEHLATSVSKSPLMMIFKTRLKNDYNALTFKNLMLEEYAEHCSELHLKSLSNDVLLNLAQKQLSINEMSSDLRGLILRKCEGNPLYLNELLLNLTRNNLIAENEVTGQLSLKPIAGRVMIPDSLRGIISASIDNLEDETKEVLKIASVIGRDFIYRLLEAIEKSKNDLITDLKTLVNENLIFIKSKSNELEYSFYHDLIRDAAYETILLKHRKKLHGKVAETIESLFHDQLDRFYGLLSYHFAKASKWEKARYYFLKAGDQANKIASDTQALSYYKKAMSIHEKLYGNNLDSFEKAVYQRKLGEIYFRRGEHDKALNSLKQSFELLGLRYPFSKWQIRFGIFKNLIRQFFNRLWFININSFTSHSIDSKDLEVVKIYETMSWIDFYINPERMAYNITSALNFAEKIRCYSRSVQASSGMGLLFDSIGFPSIAIKYHTISLNHVEKTEDDLIIATVNLLYGYNKFLQGDFQISQNSYDKAAAGFKNIGHLKKWGNAKFFMAFLSHHKGAFLDSIELCERNIKIGFECGDKQIIGHAKCLLGFNQVLLGDMDLAKNNLEESIRLLKSIPDYYALADAYSFISYYHMKSNNFKRALIILEENEKLITAKQLKGFILVNFYTIIFEVYLTHLAAQTFKGDKQHLKKTKKYLKKCLKLSKTYPFNQPKAFRLAGLFYFLCNEWKKAQKYWDKGLRIATQRNFLYEKGKINFELGYRFQDLQKLEESIEIYRSINTELEMQKAMQSKKDLELNK